MSEEAPRSFWSELKHRKVVRVAALYLAVGWGIVVASGELTGILELPGWTPRLVLVLMVLGFPVAVVLAWAFELTPEGVRRTETPVRPGSKSSRAPFFAGVVVGIASLSIVAFLAREDGPEADAGAAELDPNLVAVVPFRYSGPDDLSYLGDGVFQLLASRMTGEVGPRATDPTATAAIWDVASAAAPASASDDVARQLGAALVVTGSVVAGPDGLDLRAVMRDVRDGSEVASAPARGAPDSLAAVVERLAAGLISLSVGEYEESLAQLTSADPEALREYLQGQVEFRHGRWITAYDHFERAVRADSTFALAALWLADAGNNIPGSSPGVALNLAWRHRDRLSERDRVYLRARLGPSHPEPDTREERVRAYQEALRLAPDRANLWYFLGEETLHWPTSFQSFDRARQYFERALELDPRNANAHLHLFLTDLARRDLDAAIADRQRLLLLDTTKALHVDTRRLEAIAAGDTAAAVAVSDTVFAESPQETLLWMPIADAHATFLGAWQVGPALRGLETLRRQLIPGSSSSIGYVGTFAGFLDLGMPRRALDVLEELERGTPAARLRVLNALYGLLPEAVGVEAAALLERPGRAMPDERGEFVWSERVALELWRMAHGDLSGVPGAVTLLRAAGAAEPPAVRMTYETSALLLEAIGQARRGEAAARGTVDAMDALFVQRPPGMTADIYNATILAAAGTYERLGDPAKALAVLERETWATFTEHFGAHFARERGRLAALTGDTALARQEYGYYLAMRAQADPELQAEVAEVRAAYEALGGR